MVKKPAQRILSPLFAIRYSLFAFAIGLGSGSIAHAQQYPAKPIKLVVGFPAGGATDTTARLIAQRMQTSLGQTIVARISAAPAARSRPSRSRPRRRTATR